MKKLALAYCADNLPEAQAISKALQHSVYEIQHFDCKSSTHQFALADRIARFEGTAAILLISDNFLKSISCMNRALNLLQQKTVRILPIIVDGVAQDENTGQMIAIPTQFERIGDIIPYINYWQNQYLDLRGQKKRLEQEEGLDHEAFSNHLRMLREVSSEASEFLRLLRNTYNLKIEELFQDQFKALFDFLEDEEGWKAFIDASAEIGEVPSRINVPMMADGPLTDIHPEPIFPSTPETGTIHWDEDASEEKVQEAIEPVLQEAPPQLPYTPDDTGDNLLVDLPLEGGFPPEQIQVDGAPDDVPSDELPAQDEPTPGESERDEEKEMVGVAGTDNENLRSESLESQATPERPAEAQGEIEGLLLRAVELANTGNYDECIGFLAHAVSSHPNAPELRYYYALILAQNANNYGPATEQLNILLAVYPDDEQANFLAGQLHELQQQNDAAVHFYSKVAEVNPAFPDIFYRLGFAALNSEPEHPEKAAKFFKKACKANPTHVDAHYQYALRCIDLQDKAEKAEKYLEKTLDLNPSHPFANYDLAMLHHRNHALGRARKYYLRAVEINPELKTRENDLAFGIEMLPSSPSPDPVQSELPPNLSDQEMLIQTLKDNIAQFEKILHSYTAAVAVKEEEPPRSVQTVCITGASSGIGKATAEVFASHGYRLILTARRGEMLDEVCKALHERYGAEIYPLVFDVRNPEAVHGALESLPQDWQVIDILVNNAGKAKGFEPFQEGRMEHWEEMIDTNIKGLLYVSRAIAPGMVARQKGHIINIGSIAGKEVYPKGNVYCASKAAVDALTTGMRLDLHSHNIRVGQVNPGHVEDTEFALVRFDGDEDRAKIYSDFKPLTARDVAETIFFIASQPPHVNIQDVVMYGTQQASATVIDRSGR
jgi:NADP-dependent 3-hydroxy acid dehydrogenase YdfG/tetratricopeptide (TPR) repeat protein